MENNNTLWDISKKDKIISLITITSLISFAFLKAIGCF